MDERDRETAEAAVQAAGAVANGVSNVLVAVLDGLAEKGVFSTGDIRAMLRTMFNSDFFKAPCSTGWRRR